MNWIFWIRHRVYIYIFSMEFARSFLLRISSLGTLGTKDRMMCNAKLQICEKEHEMKGKLCRDKKKVKKSAAICAVKMEREIKTK